MSSNLYFQSQSKDIVYVVDIVKPMLKEIYRKGWRISCLTFPTSSRKYQRKNNQILEGVDVRFYENIKESTEKREKMQGWRGAAGSTAYDYQGSP